MKLAALVSVLASLSVVAPASARTVLLGRSWQGRPIRAVEVGNRSGTRVLVVGCIHGNETAGIAIAGALERLAPSDLDLWVVPDLNSDGVAAGTRQNAHGVDLNRNFPWHWRPMSGVYASGPRPLSEFARVCPITRCRSSRAARSPGRTTPCPAPPPSPPSCRPGSRTRPRSAATCAPCSRPHARADQRRDPPGGRLTRSVRRENVSNVETR
jgi:Zinc carboxypeptidase